MKVSETVSAAQKPRSPLQHRQQELLKAEVRADDLIPQAFSMSLPSASSHCPPLSMTKMGCFSCCWHFVSYAAPLHPSSEDGKSTSPAHTMISTVLSSFTFVRVHFEMSSENKLGS